MEGESSKQRHPASKLGEYRILGDIAEGTFGKVKKAMHILTGQTVAMKFLSKDAITTSNPRTRVMREVRYMRMLKHPHIVKLYEVISTSTHIILVLEYINGELFDYIVRNGRMPESQGRCLFQQIISALDYSHRLKVVHRDLKPENVLLDDEFNVKLTDFGLSNVVTDGEFLQTSCGSPNYAAPEVIRGLRYTGPEIDVWSCGVILYVMLCGRLPFEDTDPKILFAQIDRGEYYEPPFLSQEARALIAKMLAVNPVKRITVPEILETSFYKTDLPRYLLPLPTRPIPLLGTLTSLVSRSAPASEHEWIKGLGRIENDVVEDLADTITDVGLPDIWEALRTDYGLRGNAVKVAYMLLRDRRRKGPNLSKCEEKERDIYVATLNLSANTSQLVQASVDANADASPLESSFVEEDVIGGDNDNDNDAAGDEEDDGNTWEEPPPPPPPESHFAVLHSSLPGSSTQAATQQGTQERDKRVSPSKRKRTRWRFGIQSRSPPMEVMLEIYRALRAMGMEWKEKKSLGGLGGRFTQAETARIERRKELDGAFPLDFSDMMDQKLAASIYYVEARAKVEGIVVLLDLQLYQIDEGNYLVDFKHQGYYRAATNPEAKKFDRAPSPPPPSSSCSDTGSSFSIEKEHHPHMTNEEQDSTVSPFLFLDLACRLIVELAGGGEPTASASASTQAA